MRAGGGWWRGFLGVGLAAAGAGVSRADAVRPVKAVVLRSQGTQFLNMTIWRELNAGWSQFGDVPVEIDYWSLAGYGWTFDQIAATGADVLILSNPGYLTYWASEIEAVRQYVQSGHGLIITYGKFRSEDRALAPLVGISESIWLGTGTASHPIHIDPLVPDHPVFAGLEWPYVSGVRANATPYPYKWILDGGVTLGNLFTEVSPPRPGIIAKEGDGYRGLYFSYYIEDRSDDFGGSNEKDMRVFYNGLLWTAGVPEPGTLGFLLLGTGIFRRRARG